MTTDPRHPACIAMGTPMWPPTGTPNGIVMYTSKIRPALQAAGVRVILLAGGDDPDERDIRYPMRLPGKLRRWWRSAMGGYKDDHELAGQLICRAVTRLGRREGIELIEMEESFGWCAEVAVHSGVPVVGRLHGPWFMNGPALGVPQDAQFHERVERERRGIVACQGMTSPSRDVLDRTRAYYGIPLPHARVIHYPIDLMPEDVRWRSETSERDTILFVGRFDRHKGGDTMLDAFWKVAERRPKARLTFIGPDRGYFDDKGRRWSLPEYLERLPASIRARIDCPGFRPVSELPGCRAKTAVTVICSRYETSGYTVLEGMAGGCPMVVTRCGGPTELVSHERSALMCEPGDPDGLAAQIERILDDPAMSARLGAAALQDAAQRFNPARIAAETIDYYRALLHGGLGSAAHREPTPTLSRSGAPAA